MKQFLKCERGATALEYMLIAALVAIAMLAGLTLAGGKVSGTYNNTANKVSKSM